MNLNTPRMSRAEAKARTRQLLLDAARDVFATKGFNAATVEEIVERAGFTRGAFYANWGDKTELMWELVRTELDAQYDGLSSALEGAELDDKLEVFQNWYDRLLEPKPLRRAFDELTLSASETAEGRVRLAEVFAAERRSVTRVLDHIEEVLGVKLPIPAEHFAAIGYAIGQGLAMQHLVDPEAVPSTLFGDAQAYLWFGVLAATASGQFTPQTGTRTPARRRRGGTRS